MQSLARPFPSIAVLATVVGSALVAQAQVGCPPGRVLCRPASLLLFPEIDDRQAGEENLFDADGFDYLVTVTNTSSQSGVDVEFVYIDASSCLEFNRTEHLTANDTLSVITRFHNPKATRGYLYVFAKSPTTGMPIAFDHLVGAELVYAASQFGELDYSHKPFAFPAGPLVEGSVTDLDFDGIRDLDGLEYRRAPDELLIPRFMGQANQGTPQSDLILIALSGGAAFSQTFVDFLVMNDNEELFSSQTTFYCWTKRALLDLGTVYSNAFLQSTNHAPNEILNWNQQETGWMRLNGQFAASPAATIIDPAILAVLIERQGNGYASDLPFGYGAQDNGALLPHGLFGDP